MIAGSTDRAIPRRSGLASATGDAPSARAQFGLGDAHRDRHLFPDAQADRRPGPSPTPRRRSPTGRSPWSPAPARARSWTRSGRPTGWHPSAFGSVRRVHRGDHDPRVSGTHTATWSMDAWEGAAGASGARRLENAGGAWEGPLGCLYSRARGHHHDLVHGNRRSTGWPTSSCGRARSHGRSRARSSRQRPNAVSGCRNRTGTRRWRPGPRPCLLSP